MDFDQYKNTLTWPAKSEIAKQFTADLDLIDTTPMSTADRTAAKEQVQAKIKAKLNEARVAYDNETVEKRAKFEKDCEEEFGFADLPPRTKSLIHARAWDAGHSSGFHEVYNYYSNLVEIAQAARANE